MKFKWRVSDRLPVSFQAAFLFFSLVIVLSVVSYQMLPATTWGDNFSTLLWGVSTYAYTDPGNTTSPRNFQTTVDDAPLLLPGNHSVSDLDVSAAPLPLIIQNSWSPVPSNRDNFSKPPENPITRTDAVPAAIPAPTPAPTPVSPSTLLKMPCAELKFDAIV
jgi:hypothetical protein